jgi:hypothetical protein
MWIWKAVWILAAWLTGVVVMVILYLAIHRQK